MTKRLLHIQGMHGLGDCLHQRAIIRQLLPDNDITLETSWPSVYHDLPIKCLKKPVGLRTQAKNAQREFTRFAERGHPSNGEYVSCLRLSYSGDQIKRTASKTVLEAMCDVGRVSYASADFTIPVPTEWKTRLRDVLGDLPHQAFTRPWMVYRPLTIRPEWRGSHGRNPDPAVYAALFRGLRDSFFVVSVADLAPGCEWISGPDMDFDLRFHAGELHFELLAALFQRADLVYTPSGCGAILGPSVGTTNLSIVGGYELTGCHDSGRKFAPYLALGPIQECGCWSSACGRRCSKQFDASQTIARLQAWLADHFQNTAFHAEVPRAGERA